MISNEELNVVVDSADAEVKKKMFYCDVVNDTDKEDWWNEQDAENDWQLLRQKQRQQGSLYALKAETIEEGNDNSNSQPSESDESSSFRDDHIEQGEEVEDAIDSFLDDFATRLEDGSQQLRQQEEHARRLLQEEHAESARRRIGYAQRQLEEEFRTSSLLSINTDIAMVRKEENSIAQLRQRSKGFPVPENSKLEQQHVTRTVRISNCCFKPRQIRIPIGGTVVWETEVDDYAGHIICCRSACSFDESKEGKTSENKLHFESPTILSGETYTRTFNEAGVFSITNPIYTFMRGEIIVRKCEQVIQDQDAAAFIEASGACSPKKPHGIDIALSPQRRKQFNESCRNGTFNRTSRRSDPEALQAFRRAVFPQKFEKTLGVTEEKRQKRRKQKKEKRERLRLAKLEECRKDEVAHNVVLNGKLNNDDVNESLNKNDGVKSKRRRRRKKRKKKKNLSGEDKFGRINPEAIEDLLLAKPDFSKKIVEKKKEEENLQRSEEAEAEAALLELLEREKKAKDEAEKKRKARKAKKNRKKKIKKNDSKTDELKQDKANSRKDDSKEEKPFMKEEDKMVTNNFNFQDGESKEENFDFYFYDDETKVEKCHNKDCGWTTVTSKIIKKTSKVTRKDEKSNTKYKTNSKTNQSKSNPKAKSKTIPKPPTVPQRTSEALNVPKLPKTKKKILKIKKNQRKSKNQHNVPTNQEKDSTFNASESEAYLDSLWKGIENENNSWI
eukprot:g1412.t1